MHCIILPPLTHTHTHTVWQWQDENGTWQDYDPAICHQLEAAHTSSGSGTGGRGNVSFSVAGRSYTVDVGKMEQVNTATGVGRKVARRAPKGNITLQPKVTPPFIPSPLSPPPSVSLSLELCKRLWCVSGSFWSGSPQGSCGNYTHSLHPGPQDTWLVITKHSNL